ncbi:hypothetical protein ACFE04_015551 [Oxalis oulophora]
MAKLAILATSFALLFLVATATVTITTVEINEEANPTKSCQQQVQAQPLRNCQQFLTECSRMMMLENTASSRCQQQKQECCEEMSQLDKECRCHGIKKMMQRQQGQIGHQQMEKMAEKAMELPRMCQMAPRTCEMRSFWY